MIAHLLALSLAAFPSLDPEGQTLLVSGPNGEPRPLALPCTGKEVLVHGGAAYVACRAGGVVVVALEGDGAPRVMALRDLGGPAHALFVLEDQVWARVGEEARPVSAGRDISIGAAVPTVAVQGKVVRSESGRVVVEARPGSLDVGDRVEFLVDRNIDLGSGESAGRLERVAIGEVTATGKERVQVTLGLNQSAPVGARARRTQLPLPPISDAPRAGGLWQVELAVRPFIAIGDTGFGNLSEVAVGYRFDDPVHLELRLEPLGIAFQEAGGDTAVAAAAALVVSWDTRAFEIGLGLGISTINNANYLQDGRDAGAALAQMVRLGPTDGVNVSVHGLLATDDRDEFAFASLRASLQAPVGTGTWLVLRGGGGVAAYGVIEGGLRVLVRGNGTAGSLFLTPLVGYTGVWADRATRSGDAFEVRANGLLVGVGGEWRL